VSAYLILTLSALCFGGTWVAGEVAVAGLPPMTIASVRFIVASALLYAWARIQGHEHRRVTVRDLPLILTLGASAIAIYNALFLYGLRLAPASDGAIIVPGFAPVFTALLAWPMLKERIGPWTVAGFAVALAGLYLVVGPGGGEQSSNRLLGDLFFVLGAVCWGVYAVAGKTATARFTPLTSTLYGTVAGTLMLIPFGLAERGWEALAAAPAVSWAGLLYLATFGTVLAFVFFYEGVKRIGAGPSSAFAFLVPVIGVISSVLLLDEHLTLGIGLGGALVLAGLWLVQRGAHAAPLRDAPAIPPAATR
jgi:drug/metabolite transporter (DMT)-like permease